jgi:glucose/mannose-6-phosphate isomerase
MLDDLKYIHERDAQDALGVAEKQGQQLQHTYDVSFTAKDEIRNVILAGMGGSALPGVFLQSWPGLSVPFEIVRNYSLPKYADSHTLVIASSYSGNTEEALEALADAEARGAQVAVIAAGGKLAALATEKGYPLFAVPGGIQPRMSSFYFMAAFVHLLGSLGLIPDDSGQQLKDTAQWLQSQAADWRAEVPTAKNSAKQLAQELMGKTVIVYGGPLMAAAANKMKICMNENAKNLAWWNAYPEFNHNEMIGWSSHPTEKPFAVVEIRSKLEHPRVQKRFEVAARILSGMRPAPHVIEPQGDTLPKQLFWSSMYGDFVSIYLALLNGINPTPVDLVEKFKKALDE